MVGGWYGCLIHSRKASSLPTKQLRIDFFIFIRRPNTKVKFYSTKQKQIEVLFKTGLKRLFETPEETNESLVICQ
jgi:hypothetical protein